VQINNLIMSLLSKVDPLVDPNKLSPDKEAAINIIKSKKNVFISGGAGAGKSFFLVYLKKNFPNIHLTASTGIASLQIGGQTIHSWSGIGIGKLPANKLKFSNKVISRILRAKILAIDEISMISIAIFDLVNDAIKIIKGNNKPFGGIQIIIFGDFFQLPPPDGDYCFNSKSWKDLELTTIILKKIHRQTDEDFINLLNNIRMGTLCEKDIEILRERTKCKCEDEIQPTRLVSHNDQADEINQKELKKIKADVYTFNAKYKGMCEKIDFLKKSCLAHDILNLKVGAHVMMIKNTYSDQGIINGSVGIVKEIDMYPVVLFENGARIKVIPEIWSSERYDDDLGKIVVEASIEQIPLIFSWCITIHKSQSMTLTKIRCDLSRVFTFGQSYTALSRVTSLQGLYIDDIDFSKIRANQSVIDFYSNLELNLEDLKI
jgi:ATP-dependent DNA helicase PIF1